MRMGDMKVAVEKQLQAEAPQIAAKALERLKSERTRALAALPAKELGQTYGSESWRLRITVQLGLESTFRSRGRLRKLER